MESIKPLFEITHFRINGVLYRIQNTGLFELRKRTKYPKWKCVAIGDADIAEYIRCQIGEIEYYDANEQCAVSARIADLLNPPLIKCANRMPYIK